MHALMEFPRPGADGKKRYGVNFENYMWYFFMKVGHSDLVLLGATCSDKMHALMEFRRSRTYENGNMGMNSKTNLAFLWGIL